MSYEYEKQIKDDLKALHEMRKFAEWRAVEMNIDDKYAELDHVYAQAAKADEYEAKAKAFDEIFKMYIGYEDGWIHFPRGRMSFNKEIINVCKYYESGEYDAKK